MSPAAQLANLLAQRFVKSTPVNLNQLCDDLGLRIREVPAKGFDGALVRSTSGQKGIVAVRASIRESSRKRFTIAHEIGHFVIPHHRLLKNICEEKKIDTAHTGLNRPEVEANEFAAELLLPSSILRQRFNLREFSLEEISTVASECQTSLTATVRCFLNLTSLQCAMVWSVANQAQWCARSDSFRSFLVLDDLPANGSFAAKIFNGGKAPSAFAPVPVEAWLDRKAAERVEILLEYSLPLPTYDAVLSLLWVYKPAPAVNSENLLDELDPEEFTVNRRQWPT